MNRSRRAQQIDFFFIHGGPGLNSAAEEQILGPAFQIAGKTAYFWNEPSYLRQSGFRFQEERAFENWFASLSSSFASLTPAGNDRKIHLIAHSFGAFGAVLLAREFQDRIASVSLISPAFQQFRAHQNILKLALEDFRSIHSPLSSELEICLEATKTLMDPLARRGLELAFQDPALLSHYWHDPAQMQKCLSFLTRPETQPDLGACFRVLDDFAAWYCPDRFSSHPPIQLPTIVLLGDYDPVIDRDLEITTCRRIFENPSILQFDRSSHYLHVDQERDFIESVLNFSEKA